MVNDSIDVLTRENEKLKEALRKREKIVAILSAISIAVRTTVDLVDLFETIHKILETHIGAKNLIIGIVDKKRNRLEWPYFVDEANTGFSPINHFGRPQTDNPTVEAIKHGASLFFNHEDIQQKIKPGQFGDITGSIPYQWLCVPLKVKHEVLGTIITLEYHQHLHGFK